MPDEELIYYTYIYLDPRKPGMYEYDSICFYFEPFYVGKGKGNRLYFHLDEFKNKKLYKVGNKRKMKRILDIINLGINPLIIKLIGDVSNTQAIELERTLIQGIGRADLHRGPLLNLTDGGESMIGTSNPMFGKRWSVERRDAFSKFQKKKWEAIPEDQRKTKPLSQDTKEKLRQKLSGVGNPMYGKKHSEDTRQKMKLGWQNSSNKKTGVEHHASKQWRVVSPSGVEFIVWSLHNFCKTYADLPLNYRTLKKSFVRGVPISHGACKGWVVFENK